MTTERAKALELAIGQIDRQFGRGAIMRLGEAARTARAESISTGSISLDIALGIGGIPRGRVTETYGAEASGKSTLGFHVMAECQKVGGTAAYIDAEHALDPVYSAKCGVDTNELLVSQPDSAEQALEICEYLVRSGAVDLVVVDSVAALVPRAELEGRHGRHPRRPAGAPDVPGPAQAHGGHSSLQHRRGVHKPDQREGGRHLGQPRGDSGGRALKFYSSVRIDLRRIESLKQGNEIVGSRVRARVVKNKVAPPFRVAEFDIMFSEGISREGDLVELGEQHGLIKKSGSFYSFSDTRLGQGRENAKMFLKEHPDLASNLEKLIRREADPEAEAAAEPETPVAAPS